LREPPTLYSVDLLGCTALSGLPPAIVKVAFAQALEAAGATVVQEVSRNVAGTGLTCVLILAESHAILHTWPETGTVNIDIFSCSARLRTLAVVDELSRAFGANGVSVQEIPRADGHSATLDARR
jgi:S-adenosylmethionine/arginine decarboxylase-like enzyme